MYWILCLTLGLLVGEVGDLLGGTQSFNFARDMVGATALLGLVTSIPVFGFVRQAAALVGAALAWLGFVFVFFFVAEHLHPATFAGEVPNYQLTPEEKADDAAGCTMCNTEFGLGIAAEFAVPASYAATIVTSCLATTLITITRRPHRRRIQPPSASPAVDPDFVDSDAVWRRPAQDR